MIVQKGSKGKKRAKKAQYSQLTRQQVDNYQQQQLQQQAAMSSQLISAPNNGQGVATMVLNYGTNEMMTNDENDANDEENIVIDMPDEDDDDDADAEREADQNHNHYQQVGADLHGLTAAYSTSQVQPSKFAYENGTKSAGHDQESYHHQQHSSPALTNVAFSAGDLIWFDPNQLGYMIPGKVLDFYPDLSVLTVEGCGQPIALEDTQLDDLTRNRLLLKADEELQVYELSDLHLLKSIKPRRPISDQFGVPDLVDMEELSLESIIWNLKLRQKQELVYTKCGQQILVSVNPFKQLCNTYNLDQVNKYDSINSSKLQTLAKYSQFAPGSLSSLIRWLLINDKSSQQVRSRGVVGEAGAGCSGDEKEPHIFGLANEALKKLLTSGQDQCFVLLGDSGSGKTEACKLLVQYFATVNKSPTNLMTEQILESIQVLESFGNAKTILNDNSSRFGKLLELRFNLINGFILDAKTIDLNLLDRTRIVCQSENERNYNVFYELLAGLNKGEKEKYGLQSADKYFYLNQGHCVDLATKDDGEDFRSLLASMQVLGLNYEEQDTIFRILASVLHLGNIYFHRKVLAVRWGKLAQQQQHHHQHHHREPLIDEAHQDNRPAPPVVPSAGIEGVEIGSSTEVRWVSHLLQIQFDLVMRCLTVRTTETTPTGQQDHQSSDCVVTPLNIDQALDTRDAIARALYACLFKWLVQRINVMINANEAERQHPPPTSASAGSTTLASRASDEPLYLCRTSESLCEFQPDKLQQAEVASGNRAANRLALAASKHHQQQAATISILDAFGFENLAENNFEQLCINYAAELLSYHTHRYLVRLEQAEYARERLRWQPIGVATGAGDAHQHQHAYATNSLASSSSSGHRAAGSIVNLISKKPLGILALLDDECNFPKATDQSFAEKCHHNHALNDNYQCARLAANCQEFGVRHFRQASRMVWYQVDGFIEKNRDSLRPDVLELLLGSKMSIVADMLRKIHRSNEPGYSTKTLSRTYDGRYVSMKPRAGTVAARFQDALHNNQVLESLNCSATISPQASTTITTTNNNNSPEARYATSSELLAASQRQSSCSARTTTSPNAWFVVCLKPNRSKSARVFEVNYVQEQVKSMHLFDLVRMRRFGYPVRMRYGEFVRRYKCLVPSKFLNNLASCQDIQAASRRLQAEQQQQVGQDEQQQAGNNQQIIKKAIRDVCSSIVEFTLGQQGRRPEPAKGQYQCGLTKMFLNEKLFHQLEKWRLAKHQKAIELIQKTLRMWLARREYLLKRQATIVIQARLRAYVARRQFWRQYSLIVGLQRRWRLALRAKRRHQAEARRRALQQQQQHQLQQLQAQQSKQSNQFRYRLHPSQLPPAQVGGQKSATHNGRQPNYSAGLLDIPDDLAQLYRLQRSWTPIHDLTHVTELDLVELVAKERHRIMKHKNNHNSVPFFVIGHQLAAHLNNSDKQVALPDGAASFIEQLESDERYSLQNFLLIYYPIEAPQFGYSRLPITRPFTWAKMMHSKRAKLNRMINYAQMSSDTQLDHEQIIRRRFLAIEQKAIAAYKLILRYIDSDQSLQDQECVQLVGERAIHNSLSEEKQVETMQKLLKFKLISDYINYLCLTEPLLRDEVFLQLCSQTWQNPKLKSTENTWKLFLNCLACFEPLDCDLIKFLLKYSNDYCCDKYRKTVCTRLWQALGHVSSRYQSGQSSRDKPCEMISDTLSNQRRYPTTLLEYWANHAAIDCLALSASCYMDDHSLNGFHSSSLASHADQRQEANLVEDLNTINYSSKTIVQIDSHTSAEQLAREVLKARRVNAQNLAGWSVEVQHEGALSEFSSRLRGDDHLLDHFARLELVPELVQLIDDDLETFECEQAGDHAIKPTSQQQTDDGSIIDLDEHLPACCRDQAGPGAPEPADKGRGIEASHRLSTNSQRSWDNSSQLTHRNKRHSAALSDFDLQSNRSSRLYDHQWPLVGPADGLQPNQIAPLEAQYAGGMSAHLHRRSMSMQELQLAASSALNGRYFMMNGLGVNGQAQASAHYASSYVQQQSDCCRSASRRHSGSLRHLESAYGQHQATRRRSGTPNSMVAGGYQSSSSRNGVRRLSSSAYGSHSSSARAGQQYTPPGGPAEPSERQQRARAPDRGGASGPSSRRSASTSARAPPSATQTADHAPNHSDYERIGQARQQPAPQQHSRLAGGKPASHHHPKRQPAGRQARSQNALGASARLRAGGQLEKHPFNQRTQAAAAGQPTVQTVGHYAATSSAMSDTSEAPSLASHVRGVKVPHNNGDLDQYLDDLFNPLLDEADLDELSDARSLATSIRGTAANELIKIWTDPLALARVIQGTEPAASRALDEQNGADDSSQRGQLSPTFESLLKSLKTQGAADLAAGSERANTQSQLDKMNLSELKALNERLESEIQAAQSARLSLDVLGADSVAAAAAAASIPAPPPQPSFKAPSQQGGNVLQGDVYSRVKTIRIGKWRWPPACEDVDMLQLPACETKKRTALTDDELVSEGEHSCATTAAAATTTTTTTNGHDPVAQASQGAQLQVGSGEPDGVSASGAVGRLKISSEMKAKLEQLTNSGGRDTATPPGSVAPGIVSQARSLLEGAGRQAVDGGAPRRLAEQRKNLLEHQLRAGRPAGDDGPAGVRPADGLEGGAAGMDSPPSGSKVLAAKQQLAAAAGVALAALEGTSGASSQASSRRQSGLFAGAGGQADGRGQLRASRHLQDELGPQSRDAISQRQAFYLISASSDRLDRLTEPAASERGSTGPGGGERRQLGLPPALSSDNLQHFGAGGAQLPKGGGLCRATPMADLNEAGQQESEDRQRHLAIERLYGKSVAKSVVRRQHDDLVAKTSLVPAANQWVSSCSPEPAGPPGARLGRPVLGDARRRPAEDRPAAKDKRAQVYGQQIGCLAYANVDWQVRVRKEVFLPSESYEDPLVVQLIFAQLVADVFNPRHWTRLNNKERAAIKSMMKDNSIGYAASLPKIGQLQEVKRDLVRMARSFGLYFTRSYRALNLVHVLGGVACPLEGRGAGSAGDNSSASSSACSDADADAGSPGPSARPLALALARRLRAANRLGLEWLDMVAVHHSGLRLVALVGNHKEENGVGPRHQLAAPPVGYKVLETLKFRDMAAVSLVSERVVLVSMRNGRKCWLISSSQANQLAALLNSFHADYNHHLRSGSSERARKSPPVGHRRPREQTGDNKTLPHQSRTDSLGDRSLGEDALLASDDDHHGDHLEQRQAANSIDKLRTPADADDVLADGGRILPDDLANFTAPAPARGTGDTSDGRQRGGGEPGRLPAGGPSWRAGAHGGGRAHDCGGHGGGHQQQPAATVGQPGAPADDDPRRPARESGDTERRLEAASHTDHQACGADQRRTGSGGASKQRAGASLWQNSLSRMSNKLNLFAGSTKRRTGAKSKPKAGGGGAGADAHQEQVMLDSWIETKVDFDEDEDTGDECQRPPMGTSSQRAREPAPTLGGAHQDQGSAADARTLQPPQTPVAHKQQPAPARPGQSDAAGQGHSASAKDDGKYSMLQFALYNFREAIEKYSLESRANKFKNKPGSPSQQVRHACEPDDHHQVGDTSTLRGSLKLIESLRNGNTSLAGAGEQAPTGAAKLASNNNNNGQWTWAELAQMVKFTTTPIKRPLLKLANSNDDLDRRAVDCFAAIMQYMGDLPSAGSSNKHNHHQMLGGEFECVYLILINCHNYPVLRDEIYCQLIKQTTNNRSLKTDSCLRGWRLFSLVAAYFDCSPTFRPYLVKYLETAAYDKRRAYHSIASLCLQNLRKTFKYKGRKNVPSIEEIAATSAGRNSKRQIYRLPGGTERVINTKSTTVVDDIIHEICSNMLSVTDPDEMLEYSLYCIADGDLYTMPLNRDEYILDITTELIKNHQQYFLIFCRSIWHYPLRMDSQLYIEVIFNQIAPDYLEGLFLVLPALSPNHLASTSSPSSSSSSSRPPASGRSSAPISHSSPSADLLHHQNHKHPLRLKSKLVKEIARIAALLHRASGTDYIPHKDEIKYLLPKPIASAIKQQQRASNSSNDPIHQLQSSSSSGSSAGSTKNHQTEDYQHQHQSSTDTLIMSPQKWIELVQENCREMSAFDALDAKAQFLDIVRHWPLFGSSFFAIKLIQRDLIHPMDFILALNKLGIQMLDPITHETVHKYPFNEVVSTRKVRSEDGTLFLDMKCGNLMKRTIIRIQTDQAHEISRLIRQYIDIEMLQTNKIQQQRQQQQTGIVYSSSQMQQRTFFSSQNDEPTDASEQNE